MTNKDLADVLGNFVSRVTKFCRSKFGEAVPAGGRYEGPEEQMIDALTRRIARLNAHWEAIELRKAAAETRAIWADGNEYLQAAAPWVVVKKDPERAAAIVRFALNLVRLYAIVSRPFVPDVSDTILKAFRIESQALDWPGEIVEAMHSLSPGDDFEVPENLFAKITDEVREQLAERFGVGEKC